MSFAWISYWDTINFCWLTFGDLDLIFKVTAALKLPILPLLGRFFKCTYRIRLFKRPGIFKRDLDLIFKVKIGLLFNKSWLGFGKLDLIFKVTVEHNCFNKNAFSALYHYMYIHVSQELMYGILPNLHRYHRERTMSSLCLLVCTTF